MAGLSLRKAGQIIEEDVPIHPLRTGEILVFCARRRVVVRGWI